MSGQQNLDGDSPFNTRQFYESLLAYVDMEVPSNERALPGMVAFLVQDGSIKFSVCAPLFLQLDILEESRLSDRLLVIVCVAYLEDQIRLSLTKFLTKGDETGKLLDPANGPLLFLDAARLAFSLGLVAKEWFEVLKEMAKFRNKFAHDPLAQSFEDLIKKDSKQTWKSLDQLTKLYKLITQRELNGTIHENFSEVFRYMYTVLQFSIDHIAVAKTAQKFEDNEIVGINYLVGFTREHIQHFIDGDWKSL